MNGLGLLIIPYLSLFIYSHEISSLPSDGLSKRFFQFRLKNCCF